MSSITVLCSINFASAHGYVRELVPMHCHDLGVKQVETLCARAEEVFVLCSNFRLRFVLSQFQHDWHRSIHKRVRPRVLVLVSVALLVQ